MEIIIAIVVVALGVALYFNRKKEAAPESVDAWTPPKELHLTAEAPVQESAPAVAPAKEVTTDASPPAKTRKTPAKKAPIKAAAVKKPAPAKKPVPAKKPAKPKK